MLGGDLFPGHVGLAQEVIEQAVTNLGKHAKISSIAMDRGFTDGKLLWWLNKQKIIFYIPAKSSLNVYNWIFDISLHVFLKK